VWEGGARAEDEVIRRLAPADHAAWLGVDRWIVFRPSDTAARQPAPLRRTDLPMHALQQPEQVMCLACPRNSDVNVATGARTVSVDECLVIRRQPASKLSLGSLPVDRSHRSRTRA